MAREYHRKHRDRLYAKTREWKRKQKEKTLTEIARRPTVVIPDTHKICICCKHPLLLDCFHKSKSTPSGRQSWCKRCQAKWHSTTYKKDRPKLIAVTRAWAVKNRDKVNQIARNYHHRHKDLSNARARKWHHENPWSGAARRIRRQLAHQRAMPIWRNDFIIDELYVTAAKRTKTTGIRWSVDHMVPLQSALVCGLHVEANLHVIPYIANIAKGNRHWPDMWDTD